MKSLLIASAIGLVAGLIDIIPMIIKKEKKTAILSAFIHWFALGLIIPFVNWGIQPWLKGFIIGELMALPIIIIVGESDKKAILPILLFSGILGVLVSVAGNLLLN